MQYLAIYNRGVCPLDCLLTFGLSSSRGDAEKIGQFGSGFKHGILTLLREGLNSVILLGSDRVAFSTEGATLPDGTAYNRVMVKVNNRTPRPWDCALEFGALDWQGVGMALREFVSNALDASGGDPKGVDFRVVEKIRSKKGCTVVGVPMTPQVVEYYTKLGEYFLQFKGGDKQGVSVGVLDKQSPSPAKIYRKGVFVRDIQGGGGHNSLFDYNLGGESKIDECRNMDDWQTQNYAMAHALSNPRSIEAILGALSKNVQYWETTDWSGWRIQRCAETNKEAWLAVWRKCYGENAVIAPVDSLVVFGANLLAKGFKPVVITNSDYVDALRAIGIKTAYDVLDDVNEEGHKIEEPTPEVQAIANEVWASLELVGMTNGKVQPPLKMFRPLMSGRSETLGYYKEGIIYVGWDYVTTRKVYLEEYAHYITGAGDATRDFQDYAFRLASACVEKFLG